MSSDPQAAIQCEACEAGMRRAADGIHYKDGPNYKGPQTGSTWGVCRKVVAASRDPQAAIDPEGVIAQLRAEAVVWRSVVAPSYSTVYDGSPLADLLDKAAALLEQAQRETWQPIETAPKDGTEVLLTNGKYKRTGYWAHRIECWSVDAVVQLQPPTHWLLLPQPPTGDAP